MFNIEQELSDCVSLENGNGSHHITSLPLLSLLIRRESVGILYPATEPYHQISPERLLTVGTSRKEDLERSWLFSGRLIVRLQNSLFVFLNCWGYFCVIEILDDKISRLFVPLHSVSNTRQSRLINFLTECESHY